jgi:hypothetical protein
LVWDTEANTALKEWGQKQVNRIAREWAEKRATDNERQLERNPLYKKFVKESERFENKRVKKIADTMIRRVITDNPVADDSSQEAVVQMFLDYMEFDEFRDLAEELTKSGVDDIPKVIELFREWEVVEAKEMMRVTEGRIKTIEKLQTLINSNALEVPTLHSFLKEFPWVLDPRWTLIADEERFSALLKREFPDAELPPEDRRIDFLCVSESDTVIVVEIKRPKFKGNMKSLGQLEDYVSFMRDHVNKTTDPDLSRKEVVGYLLCGDRVDTYQVREKVKNLAASRIYVRRYHDLLGLVETSHKEFLERYGKLRKAKSKT